MFPMAIMTYELSSWCSFTALIGWALGQEASNYILLNNQKLVISSGFPDLDKCYKF